MKIDRTYYLQPDVQKLARDIIGKVLVTKISKQLTSGIIIETEAYNGVVDKASHAYGGLRTNRTEVMYREGGISYVYLCYGIHHLFNIVTNVKDIPHAILIRAVYPLKGKKIIFQRRNTHTFKKGLCTGPGKVCRALAIDISHNAMDLCGNKIWLEDDNIKFEKNKIKAGSRIGVDYAEEDAKLPYRFWLEDL